MNSDEVLRFWFEEAGPSKWFKKDAAFDQLIKERFSQTVLKLDQEIEDEGHTHWEQNARGSVAAVIVLDQFPRNLYRGSAKSFAFDEKALALAKRAIETGFDLDLPAEMQKSFYMPFMHSENLDDQERCVELFTSRVKDNENLRYATSHRDIIEKFGCFPHRNILLGRETTPEQQRFLNEGGFSG